MRYSDIMYDGQHLQSMFFSLWKTKIKCSAYLTVVVILLLCFALFEKAEAHLELYHNVEVNFTETAETGVVRLYFTIHAPELLVGFEDAGAEIFDAAWLRTRSDEQFKLVFKRGRHFVKEKFGFWIDSDTELDLTDLLSFEKLETIRDEKYQSGVPVACLLVSAEINLEATSKLLRVRLKKDAGKRLLLVCTRKAAFPETKDMDAGDSVEFLLPEREVKKTLKTDRVSVAQNDYSWKGILVSIGLLATILVWYMKKMSP